MSAHWRLPLLVLLWPLLWLQAWHVRRFILRMPEPPGLRAGIAGQGSLMRLLVAGDSGAAGVGAPSQDQGLCGHLVRILSEQHTVQWCVWAVNGLDSPGLFKLLQAAPLQRFDVVVLSVGANDATRLCSPLQWGRWQTLLAELIALRFAPALLVHSAVPPMHACLALPQPLRWFMGVWANQMNRSLAGLLTETLGRILHWHPAATATGMAVDRVHLSAEGYAAWAASLSPCILRGRHTNTASTDRRKERGINGPRPKRTTRSGR